MKIYFSVEVADFIEGLTLTDHTRLQRIRKLFEDYGFQIGPKYVKKITKSNLWELRAGKIRLFLCIKGEEANGVHIIMKKSQKLPLHDIKLAEKRCQQL